MDQPSKENRWLQFRLSTAVVTMIIASTHIWANFVGHVVTWNGTLWDANPNSPEVVTIVDYGWPFVVYVTATPLVGHQDIKIQKNYGENRIGVLDKIGVFINIVILIPIVLCAAFLCELIFSRVELNRKYNRRSQKRP